MPTVRYTSDGGRYRVDGTTFEPGDEATVPDGLADHLVDDVGEFERVDGAQPKADADDADVEAEDEDEDEGPPDDSLEAIMQELTIDEFEDELETGQFDGHLDEVAEAERKGKDRDGIHDAIGIRRAEIEA